MLLLRECQETGFGMLLIPSSAWDGGNITYPSGWLRTSIPATTWCSHTNRNCEWCVTILIETAPCHYCQKFANEVLRLHRQSPFSKIQISKQYKVLQLFAELNLVSLELNIQYSWAPNCTGFSSKKIQLFFCEYQESLDVKKTEILHFALIMCTFRCPLWWT